MVLRRMRVRSFDLYKTFRANGLVAATSFVQVGRITEEANGALGRVLVEKDLDPLAINVRIFGQLHFLWAHFSLRGIA
jgi:hypothetical protein